MLVCSPSRSQLLYRTAATCFVLALKRSPAAAARPPWTFDFFPIGKESNKRREKHEKLV
jgi:hypothetical protein